MILRPKPGLEKCHSFQLVTCDTGGADIPFSLGKFRGRSRFATTEHERRETHFLQPVNLCRAMTWKGFGWKLKQFAWYAKVVAARRSSCQAVLILVDGNDVSVNRGVTPLQVEQRWCLLLTTDY